MRPLGILYCKYSVSRFKKQVTYSQDPQLDVIINIDIGNLPAELEVDEFCNGDVTSLVTKINS